MTAALDLFDVRVPCIETPTPVAPGSDTSRAAATWLDASSPLRTKRRRAVMVALANAERPVSRYAIHRATGISISSLCSTIESLTPLWVEVHPGACQSHAVPSLRVNGYALTAAGRLRVTEVVK